MTTRPEQRRLRVVVVMCIATAVLGLPQMASAQTAYTDEPAFLAAIPPGATVALNDWESGTPGDFVLSGTSICEAVFTYNITDARGDPLTMQVFNAFDTTTTANYVAPEHPHWKLGLFMPGDALTLTFDPPVVAVGAQFVSCPGTLDGVFHISAMGGTTEFTADSGVFTIELADGSEPYFVGIIASAGSEITEATIYSDEELYSYSLDELIFQCTTAAFIDGDVNLDGEVNMDDLAPFVEALLYYSDPCDVATADLNDDGQVNGGDIEAFVDILRLQ